MKKYSIGSKMLSTLLVLAMTLSILPVGVFAAKGDVSNTAVTTGLTGNINTDDTISLPIKILDYENDGMLFEYAEAYAGKGKTGTAAAKTAGDFGASKFYDFTQLTSDTTVTDSNNKTYESLTSTSVTDYWYDVGIDVETTTYANYGRISWEQNSSDDWRNGNAAFVLTDFKGSVNMNDIKYVVLVYRTNVSSDTLQLCINNGNGGAGGTGHQAKFTMTSAGKAGGSSTNWTYDVFNLQQGGITDWTTTTGIYMASTMDASGDVLDLAHVAYFSDMSQATAFGEYALTDGSNRGDNRGFGLLRGSRSQSSNGDETNGYGSDYTGIFKYNNTSAEYGNAAATITQLSDFDGTNTVVKDTATNLGYTLLGEFQGIANLGLLESTLGTNGLPVYKEEVVTYLAYLLKESLEISERNSNGWKNYKYVKGTPSSVYGNVDLATALRNAVDDKTITNGDYDLAAKKNLIGKWTDVSGNISTYHDAAYFLLNAIFVEGSYNTVEDDYDYLVLSSATDTKSGDKVYVFDGGFTSDEAGTSAVKYDTDANTIQNSDASYKTQFSYEYSTTNGDSWTTLNPFLPVTDDNTEVGQTNNTYYQDDGVINTVKKQTNKDTLYERDFNFAMISEGEFVYHADDELFFEFEGDDDVYLFINDELVLDLGSAHSIDYYRFNLNDYVNAAKAGELGSDARNAALALEEGETYPFKFYYMERHSYGSNIRICTNIRVTDPSMTTAKTAWQDGTQLDFGSVVDKDKVVEYGFAITNNGEENLHNLTFTDNDIGVKLDPTNGLKVTGSRVYDVSGGTLEASDLTAVVTHPDYADINVTFADNNALKTFLTNLTASGTEAGGGLFIGATVQIRGIGYKLSDAQIAAGVFDNTVLTTSTNGTGSKTLQGQATMRVFVPADPMYYEWAGHDLKVTKTKLIEDVLAAAKTEGNLLAGKVPNLTTNNVNKIELVTKAGTAITSPYVTIDGSYNLTINYPTAGSKVFYVKVTYNSSKNTVIVPVLVNVTDVQDSVIVLDYGLPVDISAAELGKNDALAVPGRDTTYEILGFGENGEYSPNEITFKFNATKTEYEGTYGTFKLNEDKTITYTPTSFIEGADTIQIAYTVYESDITPSKIAGTLDINNEVEMYKTITIVPANVMYYEDDFTGAITYLTEGSEVVNAEGEIIGKVKVTTPDYTAKQTDDQDGEYGSDANYAKPFDNDFSAGSLHRIYLDGRDDITFTFTGTGFELIGRTDAETTGTIVVDDAINEPDVQLLFDEGIESPALEAQMEVEVVTTYPVNNASAYSMSGETMFAESTKIYPVIMEFDNGNDGGDEAIYQVPVIRIDGLAEGATHTVTITGLQAHDWTQKVEGNKCGDVVCDHAHIDTYFYFDGLRIFQPIGSDPKDSKGNPYYNEDERNAQFLEIRDLIGSGDAAVASYDVSSQKATIGTDDIVVTWTEDYSESYDKDDVVDNDNNVNVPDPDEGWTVNKVASVNEYLLEGPNNEVYMLNESTAGVKSGIFFYVKESGAAEGKSSLQLAVRALDFGTFHGANSEGLYAPIQYNTVTKDANGNDVYAWTDLVAVVSGTEQYYEIDYTKCPHDEKNGYMVAIRIFKDDVNDDDSLDDEYFGMASYSSLKLTGQLEINSEWVIEGNAYKYGNIIFTNGVVGENNASGGSTDTNATYTVANAFIDQLRSDLVVTGPVNRFPTAPSIPEIDDPFQNLPETNEPETDDNDTNDGEEESSKPSNFDLLKLFTLTAIAGEGGTITPEGDLIIAFGASRTFKFIPDEGYEIADVLVNGKSVGAVEKYVLKAAHADTVVEVLFREIPEAAADAEAAAEEAAG